MRADPPYAPISRRAEAPAVLGTWRPAARSCRAATGPRFPVGSARLQTDCLAIDANLRAMLCATLRLFAVARPRPPPPAAESIVSFGATSRPRRSRLILPAQNDGT